MSAQKPRILVGVDGTESALRAVRYAALEAADTGGTLLVVHVEPTHLPLPPVRPVEPPLYNDLSREIAEDAAAFARAVASNIEVSGEVANGPVARHLVHASQEADLVVLGTDFGGLGAVWTGRVTTAVAARAHCPVVTVPAEWRPGLHRGRVVVGYKEPDGSLDLLARGFSEASRRGAELVILHAWRLPAAYDDVLGARVLQEEVDEHVEREVEPLIAGLRETHPDVPVTVRTQHSQEVRALVDASLDADLVVVGRSIRHVPVPHLSAASRALVHRAASPVLVVPVLVSDELPDDVVDAVSRLESEGLLER